MKTALLAGTVLLALSASCRRFETGPRHDEERGAAEKTESLISLEYLNANQRDFVDREVAVAAYLSDKAALERRFELMFATSDRRDWAAERLVEKFIDDVTLYPLEWPTSAVPPSKDVWRFGAVSVQFRRYPSDQLIEVLEIRADQKAQVQAVRGNRRQRL